jgi:hypothetical protein
MEVSHPSVPRPSLAVVLDGTQNLHPLPVVYKVYVSRKTAIALRRTNYMKTETLWAPIAARVAAALVLGLGAVA